MGLGQQTFPVRLITRARWKKRKTMAIAHLLPKNDMLLSYKIVFYIQLVLPKMKIIRI